LTVDAKVTMEREMKTWHSSLAAISTAAFLSLASISCGGGGAPSTPAPVATPTPVAVATPAPVPSPEPTPEAEPPVTNTRPPVRITARLYLVEDASGRRVDYETTKAGMPIIPLGYRVRFDIVAKDAKNKETIGSGHPEWTFDPEHLIDIVTFSNEFQPRLRASQRGEFSTYATLDKIKSNTITVFLGEP
jgi:hypothetical protein